MTILSLPAVARLAERRACELGGMVRLDELLRWLDGAGVRPERAQAGVQLATVIGRLEGAADDAGEPCLRAPRLARARQEAA